MPQPTALISKKICFDANGGTISISLEFDTLLIGTYLLQLREANGNAVVMEKIGDNTNAEDDVFPLPTPARLNDNRTLWIFITLIDQTGDGGDYEVRVKTSQDDQILDTLSSGQKTIQAPSESIIFVSRLLT